LRRRLSRRRAGRRGDAVSPPRTRLREDAIIGMIFTSFFALGLFMVSLNADTDQRADHRAGQCAGDHAFGFAAADHHRRVR
jgi:hypothetical protein